MPEDENPGVAVQRKARNRKERRHGFDGNAGEIKWRKRLRKQDIEKKRTANPKLKRHKFRSNQI